MTIAILDDYQHIIETLDCFKIIAGQSILILDKTEKDPELLARQIKDAEVIVLIRERTAITEALLSRLPNLKLISQTGKIAGHIDMNACSKYNVAVAEGVGSPIAPAELTWILLMNVLRKIPEAINDMSKGLWQTNIGSTVYGKMIGIWGYGKIGKRIAGYAAAFGAKVIVWGSATSREQAVADGYEDAVTQGNFFQKADVVTLHLRLTETTRGIVKERDLEQMQPTAVLINTARAELIEEGALVRCLRRGRPGFAGVDVYEDEPVYNKDNELLRMANVTCTPHLGYVAYSSYELYFGKAFENVMAFINGNPVNIVDPGILPSRGINKDGTKE